MLIAVPTDAPGGLDALISEHFGHCDAFTIVTVEGGELGEVEVVPNGGHDQGGCMAPVRFLKARNVEVLLSGGMGMRPLAGFRSVGIEVFYKEEARTVREAVSMYMSGKCRSFADAQTCSGGSGHCGGHHHVERPAIEGPADVRNGRMVTMNFTLKDANGEVIDSSSERGPMIYLQGSGVIPGLEKAIAGLEAGAETAVDLRPSDAFGERDEERLIEVPRGQLPSDLQVGEVVVARHPSGTQTNLMVAAMSDDVVQLDGNHPLAGKDLHFDIKIVAVEAATPEELEAAGIR